MSDEQRPAGGMFRNNLELAELGALLPPEVKELLDRILDPVADMIERLEARITRLEQRY